MRPYDDPLMQFLRGFLNTMIFVDVVLGGLLLAIWAIEWWRG